MDVRVTPPLTTALRGERAEALLHGVHLLKESWADFDTARPHHPPVSDEIREIVRAPLPQEGEGVTAALDAAVQVLDRSLTQTRPRFFGYIGSSGLESAVLADALATSHDVNLAAESAAAQLVDRQVMRWVAEFVGYPASGGIVTSGGMISSLTALMVARTRAFPASRAEGLGGARATVYASAEAHSSVERAVEVLGLGRDNLRAVPIDSRRRMDVSALAAAVAQDLRDGLTPIAVVATAGTTLTGAVDPIAGIADVCAKHGMWLHVDGAYGLPAASAPETSALFAGLERADSVSLDAHKWLFVPKACGVLLLRDDSQLAGAFRHDAAYMLDEDGYNHPVDMTLEYSRPFRSLKLWVALRAHGSRAFADAISDNIRLARHLADLVRDRDDYEMVVAEPDLSVVPFRRIPARGDANEHNLRLVRAMQDDGRVFVTSAVVGGIACLRPCVVNFRTTKEDVEAILEVADEIGRRLDAE